MTDIRGNRFLFPFYLITFNTQLVYTLHNIHIIPVNEVEQLFEAQGKFDLVKTEILPFSSE